MNNKFVIFNNNVVEQNELNISFLFWDENTVTSHKLWFGYGGIPLFSQNINLLIEQIEILALPCPPLLNNKNELFRIIKRMLNKNKFYRSGYLHIHIFNTNNEPSMLIVSTPSDKFDFPLAERGIMVNFSDIVKPSSNSYCRYAFYNHEFWQVVAAQNKSTYFQNSIITNQNHAVCEAISANIYTIIKKTLYTPAPATGSYHDVLRNIIINIAADMGFAILESESMKKEDIFDAHELFIASEATGMQWILGVENKRFVHKYSEEIHLKLNEHLKESAKTSNN